MSSSYYGTYSGLLWKSIHSFKRRSLYNLNTMQIFTDTRYVQESIGYRLKASSRFSTDRLVMIGLYIWMSAPAIIWGIRGDEDVATCATNVATRCIFVLWLGPALIQVCRTRDRWRIRAIRTPGIWPRALLASCNLLPAHKHPEIILSEKDKGPTNLDRLLRVESVWKGMVCCTALWKNHLLDGE